MALTNSTTSNMTTITTTTIIASNTTSNTTTSTNTTNTTTTTIMSAGLSTNDNIDWSCTVGSIRQQGLCGSCYAFAVTDTISSLFYIYNAYNWTSYLALAVQDMIDCSYSSLSYGCLGAEVPGSYQFAVIGGLTTNDKYPYQYIAGYGNESFTKSCDNALGIEPRYFINRSFAILDPTCKNILSYLKRNPLTVEIKLNKTDLNFQFYRSG